MRRALPVFVMSLLVYGFAAGTVQAQALLLPDRIEEDWQLIIANPDPTQNGPQITTSMSPTGDLVSSPFVALDLNYREYPTYANGGMQVQVWQNKQLLASSSQGNGQFNTANETITWTQSLSLSGGSISYGISNGQSTTFGRFGQGNGLLSVSFSTALADLSGYIPDVSIAHSGATWESNHVTSMAIVQVRYFLNGQLILTDATRRDCALPP